MAERIVSPSPDLDVSTECTTDKWRCPDLALSKPMKLADDGRSKEEHDNVTTEKEEIFVSQKGGIKVGK